MVTETRLQPILSVADLDRARVFYEEKLSLKPLEMGLATLVYQCPDGSRLFLYRRKAAGPQRSVATIQVRNIRVKVELLKRNGVVFEDYDTPGLKTENNIALLGNGRYAWFKDTEGNILSLVEQKASRAAEPERQPVAGGSNPWLSGE
ncbi:MAG: VOC family protein [Dehalococcoidales bacterium]